jgi:hypothetical protein
MEKVILLDVKESRLHDKELLDIVEASGELNNSPLRPDTGREDFAVGGIDQGIKYGYKTNDIPGVVNPATGRPWQMTFGTLYQKTLVQVV